MRHKVAGRKLGRSMSHRRSLYRNLVTDLLKYDKVVTTEAKAKEVRRLAEKMITMGKTGGLPSFRQSLSFIIDKAVVEKVFSELAERYAGRPGGYTRIYRLGTRRGDATQEAYIELVVD